MKNRITTRDTTVRNNYRCSMEKNQSGKYCVRIQVHYPRHAWSLEVFFLASSFNRAMTKLEESLDFLQRNEEKLWFWGVDRAEDMGFSAEFLREAGLKYFLFSRELPMTTTGKIQRKTLRDREALKKGCSCSKTLSR